MLIVKEVDFGSATVGWLLVLFQILGTIPLLRSALKSSNWDSGSMSFISLPPVCLIPRSQVQSHIVKKKKEYTVALDHNS